MIFLAYTSRTLLLQQVEERLYFEVVVSFSRPFAEMAQLNDKIRLSEGEIMAVLSGLYTSNGIGGMHEGKTLTSWILCTHS